MINEEWKEIDNNYKISNTGKVFSNRTKKELKPWKTKKGYLRVDMGRNKREYIHRLVAEAFIENIENKPTVNHLNHDKTDNRIENLEWATYKEQTDYDILQGKRIIIKGKNGKFQKI